ncbi:AGE family epimerase/isomerase [Alteromonas oceanisediminis]|uniref:AGE family epimerase/isomerase n=1 Tax=Alteromonas oceanisediminis TaxID=2836180 RepID=UPI001BD94F88|nr:AGE family epimerase/isomerase [Alteromonas oceanisediminis]MBT0586815.1 AGE family epimerase/isomerase [Alteromonas oceanisediminis]
MIETNTSCCQQLNAAADYSQWLRSEVLPVWSGVGIDQHGASVERILASGMPDISANKRIRVQARQMFSFAYAQHRGWIDNGIELIADLDRFVEHYARKEGSGIYVHVLDANNQVINSHQDLYDCAFFLLAYAWRYHVFGDLKALNRANKLLKHIDLELKQYPGGWSEGSSPSPFRRQNPHMHLFEAFLALYRVTQQGKWLAKAGEIFCLLETRFIDHQQGVLLEYFDMKWQPLKHNDELIVEPGHMMEWVWLLRQYQQHTQSPVEGLCQSLYHNALSLGLDKHTNLLFDEISPVGVPLKATKRCWPMTEWVKASLAQSDNADDKHNYDYIADANNAIASLLQHYRSGAQYIDQLGQNNEVTCDHAPASTLYHLLMAEAEIHRFTKGFVDVY